MKLFGKGKGTGKKKLSKEQEEQQIRESIAGHQSEIEAGKMPSIDDEKKGEKAAAATGPSVSPVEKLSTELEKLSAQVDFLRQIRTADEEKASRMSEEVGEIRSMLFEKDKAIQDLEKKAIEAYDRVSSVQPEKLMAQVQELGGKLEVEGSKRQQDLEIFKKMQEELKGIRDKMAVFKGAKALLDLSKETREDLMNIKKVQAMIERDSNKAEDLFLEIGKRTSMLDETIDKMNSLENTVKIMQLDSDKLKVKLEGVVKAEDLQAFQKQINTKIVDMGKTVSAVGDFKKFSEDVRKRQQAIDKNVAEFNKVASAVKKVGDLGDISSELRKKLSAAEKKLKDADRRLKDMVELEKLLEEGRQYTSTVRQDSERLEGQLEHAGSTAQSLKESLASLKKKAHEMEAEIKANKSNKEAFKNILSEFSKFKATHDEKFTKIEEFQDSLEEKVSEVKDALSSLETDKAKLKDTIEKGQKSIGLIQESKKFADSQLDEIRRRLQSLSAASDSFDKAIRTLNTKSKEIGEIMRRAESITQLEKKLDKKLFIANESVRDLDDLKADVKLLIEEGKDTISETKRLKTHVRKRTHELEQKAKAHALAPKVKSYTFNMPTPAKPPSPSTEDISLPTGRRSSAPSEGELSKLKRTIDDAFLAFSSGNLKQSSRLYKTALSRYKDLSKSGKAGISEYNSIQDLYEKLKEKHLAK